MDHGHGHGLAPKTNSIAQGQRLFRHQSVENGKLCLLLYHCIRLGSVLFCSVLCSVLCLLFTRQFGKENRNAFIYSWTTCHAGMSSSKAARQTDLHWVPWTFWIIDHNIHSKQTDRLTDRHTYIYVLVHVWPHARTSQNSVWFMLIDKFTHLMKTYISETHIFHQCGRKLKSYWTLIINSNIIRFDNCPCHRPEIRMFTLDKNSY